MSKPTIKDLKEKLDKVTCEKDYIIEQQLKRIRHLEGSPKLQEQLKAAHNRIEELVNENQQLKSKVEGYRSELDRISTALSESSIDKVKYFNRCGEVAAINEKLFDEHEQLKHIYAESEMTSNALVIENAQLKHDLVNANSDIEKLIKSVNDVSAENYALKAEIERTNRHINLAENVINAKEHQPLVVNHYHNCTINK